MHATKKSIIDKLEAERFVAEMGCYYYDRSIIQNQLVPCLVENHFRKGVWQSVAALNYCNKYVREAVLKTEPVWGKLIVKEFCF